MNLAEQSVKTYVVRRVAMVTGAPEDFVVDELEAIPCWQEWLAEFADAMSDDFRERAIARLAKSISLGWQEVLNERSKYLAAMEVCHESN